MGPDARDVRPAPAPSRSRSGGCARSPSAWAPRASAPRSRPPDCSPPTSAPRRSSGPTRSPPCWSRCRSATRSGAGSPTAARTCAACARSCWARRCCWPSCRSSSDPFLHEAVKALGALSVGGFLGSLAAVLVLVAVPVLLLGMVAPYANRLAVAPGRRHRDGHRPSVRDLDRRIAARHVPGRAAADPADRDPPHVPGVRTARWRWPRRPAPARGASWSWPRSIAALLAIPPAAIGADVSGARVIYSTETPYQYARVLQFPSGERWLELNEGVAVHSLYRPVELPDRRLLGRLPGPPVRGRSPTPPRRIAILGDAAGTVARAYGHYFPRTRVDAVELDGELTTIGKRYFGLRGPGSAPVHRRRAAVARDEPGALRLDLPRRLPPALHPVLPAHARVLLADPRASGPGRDRDRQRRAHAGVRFAGEGGVGDAPRGFRERRARRGQRHELAGGRELAAGVAVARSLQAARTPRRPRDRLPIRSAARIGPALTGGSVYTDDKAPVEWLTDLSILQYAIGKR